MKQVNISLSFDEDKLKALNRYIAKKDMTVDAELTDALSKLYEKYVPAAVPEYIDETDVPPAPVKPKRPVRPEKPKPETASPTCSLNKVPYIYSFQ